MMIELSQLISYPIYSDKSEVFDVLFFHPLWSLGFVNSFFQSVVTFQ